MTDADNHQPSVKCPDCGGPVVMLGEIPACRPCIIKAMDDVAPESIGNLLEHLPDK